MESLSKEKVLVTGVSGYLGSHVAFALLEAGYKVRGTVRSLANEKKIAPIRNLCPGKQDNLELVEADLLSDDNWNEAVSGCKFVMHVASPFPSKAPKKENDIIIPAVEGTLRVLKACAAQGVKKVILTSSTIAVMGGRTDKDNFNEDDWAADSKANDAYGKSKLRAEKAAWDFVANLPPEQKFDLVSVNPGGIFGPALINTPFTSAEFVVKLLNNDVMGIPQIQFPFIDVRDVALMHIRALELQGNDGRRYIGSAADVTFLQMADILRPEFAQYGYKVTSKKVARCTIKFASYFDKQIALILSFIGRNIVCDNTRSVTELGINYMDVNKTLIEMAYSLIERGYVKTKGKKAISKP